jgi:hypothetical protein
VSVAADLYRVNMAELAGATGIARLPETPRRILLAPLGPLARTLASRLAEFDAAVGRDRLGSAARAVLRRFGAVPRIFGAAPASGPLLVVSNHPGTYDALSLFVALARDDVRILVAERPFLRAMPNMQKHFLYVPDLAPAGGDNLMRGIGLRHAIQHLKYGGTLLHFAAGAIEPDPAFLGRGADPLLPWQDGTAALVNAAARYGAQVLVAMVSGVCSERAKRAWIVKQAEKRGITTLAGLLQVAVPGYRDVDLRVRLSHPLRANEDFAGLSAKETIAKLQRTARGIVT